MSFSIRTYALKCKPGHNKDGYRGELEVKIGFTVKEVKEKKKKKAESTLDVTKKEKHKGSLASLNKKAGAIGGSLMNLGSKVTVPVHVGMLMLLRLFFSGGGPI